MYVKLKHCRSTASTATQRMWFYDITGAFIPWTSANIVLDEFTTRKSTAYEDMWGVNTVVANTPPYGGTNPSVIINLPGIDYISKVSIYTWGNTTYGTDYVEVYSSTDNVNYIYVGKITTGVVVNTQFNSTFSIGVPSAPSTPGSFINPLNDATYIAGNVINASWNPTTFTTGYELSYSTNNGYTWTVAYTGPNTYSNVTLTDGGTYYFRVRSKNDFGYSNYLYATGKLKVIAKSSSELTGTAFIRNVADLLSRANFSRGRINGNINIDSTGIVKNNIELPSNAILQYINTLDIKYLIKAMEDYRDIDATTMVHWVADFLSSAGVKALGSNDLKSIAQVFKSYGLDSSVFVAYNNDLDSTAQLTYNNILDLVYKVVQAPINYATGSVVQDSYIRQARPTTNYGSAQTLLVGNAVEGNYSTLMQLDIRPYTTLLDVNIVSLSLILNLVSNYDSSFILDIYEVHNSWTEGAVTWSNFTTDTSKLITSFTCDASPVKIDLRSYLESKKAIGDTTINLQIVARNASGQIIYFESKESTDPNKRPHLEIQYQENSWTGYVSNTNINSAGTIRATNSRDLWSDAIVRITSKEELESIATIRRTAFIDLVSTLIVRLTDHIDLDSLASVHPNTYLDSLVIVRNSKDEDMLSIADIYHMWEMDGVATIRSFASWLDSTVHIKGLQRNELDSKAFIMHNEEVLSSAIIQLTGSQDLPSKVTPKVPGNEDLTSIATLHPNIELLSTAVKRLTVIHDIPSTVIPRFTAYTDLDSQSASRLIDEILSTGTVRQNKSSDIMSFAMNSYGTTLDSTASIIAIYTDASTDLSSTGRVRNTTFADLNSVTQVAYYRDLSSIVTPRVIEYKDLTSLAKLYQNKDLSSQVLIRQIIDLASTGKVRLTKVVDMLSTLTIQQKDIDELDSVAYLFGMELAEVFSYLTIRARGQDYLDSKATIITSARQWVPNIHGVDVFNYQNRKLPRVWKRENFIP